MNDIPKVVFSKTLKDASWPGSSFAGGDLAVEIGALKEQPGGEIIAWGGAGLARVVDKSRTSRSMRDHPPAGRVWRW